MTQGRNTIKYCTLKLTTYIKDNFHVEIKNNTFNLVCPTRKSLFKIRFRYNTLSADRFSKIIFIWDFLDFSTKNQLHDIFTHWILF